MAERYQTMLNSFAVSLPASWPRGTMVAAPALNGIRGVSLEVCETEYENAVAPWLRDDRLAPLWGNYGIVETTGQISIRKIIT